MLITELKSKEALAALVDGKKVFIINCHGCKEVAFPEKEAALIIVNSGVKHALASSAYNDRRRECETALADINKVINASSLCALSVVAAKRLCGFLPRA